MSEVIDARPRAPHRTALTTVQTWLSAEVIGSAASSWLSGVSLSSQRVRPGDLYAALPGSRAHGADFLAEALERGAAAVLTDSSGAARCGECPVPVLVVDDPRSVLGDLAARLYGVPATALRLVAVTGTQGKTTTTLLAEGALTAAGVPAAAVGTVGTRVNGTPVATALTTPEAPDLQALFAVMGEHGTEVCVMEVSSHALVMGRVDGVVFDVAAFTNLGRDHLDFHADMEDYYQAKASLFTPQRARLGVVNIDDEHGRRLLAESTLPIRTFSATGRTADWQAVDIATGTSGSTFTLVTPEGERLPVQVALPGDYNVANALCAIAMLGEAGLAPHAVVTGLDAVAGVPGRLERVDAGQGFLAVVDYAHKPDAVSAALGALRPLTSGRLIVVLGAGGDRDPGKRPLMGDVAARLADVLIVTDDNPRREPPEVIRRALLEGASAVHASRRAELVEIGDRAKAIRWAVSLARPGDTVVIAGKGHETGQEVGDEVHPFDDRALLREALEALVEAAVRAADGATGDPLQAAVPAPHEVASP